MGEERVSEKANDVGPLSETGRSGTEAGWG